MPSIILPLTYALLRGLGFSNLSKKGAPYPYLSHVLVIEALSYLPISKVNLGVI
jgi:hypothetical protein